MSWNHDVECGVPRIDDDHKSLMELMNAVYAGMMTGEGVGDATVLIDRVDALLTEHCAEEEALMVRSSYPQTAGHQRAHREMLERLQAIRRDLQAGRVDAGRKVFEQLGTYLRDHMMKADAALADHVMGRNEQKVA